MHSDDFVPTKIIPYILSYLWHVYQCHLIATGAVVVETLIIEYQVNIVTLLASLQESFRQFKLDSENEESVQHFRRLIKFHQEVIELSEHLSELYKPIIFEQFSITAIAVCVLGFLLLIRCTNYLETFILIMFSAAVLFQPLIYSYSGERIMDESLGIANAIYENDWYELKPTDRKMPAFCIMRAQNSCGFTDIF